MPLYSCELSPGPHLAALCLRRQCTLLWHLQVQWHERQRLSQTSPAEPQVREPTAAAHKTPSAKENASPNLKVVPQSYLAPVSSRRPWGWLMRLSAPRLEKRTPALVMEQKLKGTRSRQEGMRSWEIPSKRYPIHFPETIQVHQRSQRRWCLSWVLWVTAEPHNPPVPSDAAG